MERRMGASAEDRERMLSLLEANHSFPGTYALRVVLEEGARAELMAAVEATGLTLRESHSKPSRTGKWASIRLEFEVQSAEEVLTLYAAVGTVDGVVTSL